MIEMTSIKGMVKSGFFITTDTFSFVDVDDDECTERPLNEEEKALVRFRPGDVCRELLLMAREDGMDLSDKDMTACDVFDVAGSVAYFYSVNKDAKTMFLPRE